jgi:GNAT superfamily N-acetyltransferase
VALNQLGERVRKIEEMELELAVFNAKRSLVQMDKNLQVKKIGNSTLLIEPIVPKSIYHNRVKGFGVNDLDKLDEIINEYASKNIIPCFDMTPNHLNVEVARALSNKGFLCTEHLAFLEAKPYVDGEWNQEIRILKVTEDNVDQLMESISLSTGGIGKEILERKKVYFYQPHFINYLAYIGDVIVGRASLFIHEDEGYLANDFTYAPFRGKGCQTALIYHRIREAREMGISTLYTDVEFGSTSHNNMLKIGFETVFINSFWVRDRVE